MGVREELPLVAIVLAAGKGTRLQASPAGPAALAKCVGLPIIDWILRAVSALRPREMIVVGGHDAEVLGAYLHEAWPSVRLVVQFPQNGTGDATRLALNAATTDCSTVLVVYGNVPGIHSDDLRALWNVQQMSESVAAVITSVQQDPTLASRVVRDAEGGFERIVRAREATPAELAIMESSAGAFVWRRAELVDELRDLQPDSWQGELTMIDAISAVTAKGGGVSTYVSPSKGLQKVYDFQSLAEVSATLRGRVLSEYTRSGVMIADPATTVIEPGARIEHGAVILPFSYIERGAVVAADSEVGPFAHVRAGGAQAVTRGDTAALAAAVSARTTMRAVAQEVPPRTIGDYEVRSTLGHGAMGVVYLVRHRALERLDALKLLRPEFAADIDAVARFEREVRALSALNHPHIVTVHTSGTHDGRQYFVMELVDGSSLAEHMDSDRVPGWRSVLRMLSPIADALGAAHSRDVVHRDVKPGNLMVRDSDGVVLLTDFGLARMAGLATLTQRGMTLGTPYYMAPEQFDGVSGSEDATTDIYGLGATLYHLLGGRPPFEGEDLGSLAMAIRSGDPVPLGHVAPSLPSGVCGLVMRAIGRGKSDRFADAEEMRDEMLRVIDST